MKKDIFSGKGKFSPEKIFNNIWVIIEKKFPNGQITTKKLDGDEVFDYGDDHVCKIDVNTIPFEFTIRINNEEWGKDKTIYIEYGGDEFCMGIGDHINNMERLNSFLELILELELKKSEYGKKWNASIH